MTKEKENETLSGSLSCKQFAVSPWRGSHYLLEGISEMVRAVIPDNLGNFFDFIIGGFQKGAGFPDF